MAHQAHALPWNTLASNYEYKMSHTTYHQRKDIFPVQKGGENKEIDYFCRALAQRVREFAETERAKFKPQAEMRERAETWTESVVKSVPGRAPAGMPETRMVYPVEMQVRYFEQGHEGADLPTCVPASYSCDLRDITKWCEGLYFGDRLDRADVVKLMMMEAAGTPPAMCAAADRSELKEEIMESLLLLANKPDVQLLSFATTRYGHRHPICRAAEVALRVYLYLNLLVAMQEQKKGSWLCEYAKNEAGEETPGRRNFMDLRSYGRFLEEVAGGYDGDSHLLVNWDYFYARTKDEWDSSQDKNWDSSQSKDPLADLEALKEYLKGVWRILVVYDLVVREAGGDPELEQMCKTVLGISFI